MDDMSQKISQLLNDPETMQQIMGLAGMMGNNEKAPEPAHDESQQKSNSLPVSPEGMETIVKLMPLLNNMQKEDDTTKLLHSLRPFLSENRRSKLDEAAKMLQLLKLLPALKDFNLLSG